MYDFSFPEIKIPEMTELADMPAKFMWSDTQFEIIKKHITDFENKLDQNHEVGLMPISKMDIDLSDYHLRYFLHRVI